MRYFAEIAYKGTKYCGWQTQNNALAVQQVLEDTLSKLLRQKISTTGSGRTDAGVHAYAQIAHFDCSNEFDCQELVNTFARFPLQDITLNSVRRVQPHAHARFSALSRRYVYRIISSKSAFLQEQAWFFAKALDTKLMNEAASLLLGAHDFTTFCKEGSDTPHHLCHLHHAEWVCIPPTAFAPAEVQFHVEANRFLRGMVRALVGSLLEIGLRKIKIDDLLGLFQKQLKTKSTLAPPHGLFLAGVTYPESIYL